MLNRLDEADEVARDLLGGAPGADLEYAALRGQLLVERARGSIVDVHALMQKVAEAAGAPADERRRLRCMAAAYSIILADTATQDAELGHARRARRGPGRRRPRISVRRLQGLGIVAMAAGHVADSQDYLTEAMTLFDDGQIPAATFVYSFRTRCRRSTSLDWMTSTVLSTPQPRPDPVGSGRRRVSGALDPRRTLLGRFSLGRWDDAIADAEALRSLHEMNAQGGVWTEAILARIACHRGDLDAAEVHLSVGEALLVAGSGGFGADWLLMARAEHLRCWDALTTRSASLPRVGRPPLTRIPGRLPVEGCPARAAGTRRRAPGRSPCRAARSRGRSSPHASRKCMAQRSGVVDSSSEPHPPHRRCRALSADPAPTDPATCCEDAAGVLLEGDRREEAVALLTEAAGSTPRSVQQETSAVSTDTSPARRAQTATGSCSRRSAGIP